MRFPGGEATIRSPTGVRMNVWLASLIALISVFGLLVTIVLSWIRLRRYFDERSFTKVPDKLTLKPRTGTWKDTVLMQALTSPLTARGFADVGSFSAPELPRTAIRILVNPDDGTLAAIYEHGKAGHWVDISSYYKDGTSVVYSTNPSAISAGRPGHTRYKGVGLNSGALYTRFKNERPNKPILPLKQEEATAQYLTAYAEETAWRKARGIPPDEIAAIFRLRATRSRLNKSE